MVYYHLNNTEGFMLSTIMSLLTGGHWFDTIIFISTSSSTGPDDELRRKKWGHLLHSYLHARRISRSRENNKNNLLSNCFRP